jgi:uncharacterized membrane protein YgcG
VKRPNVLIPGVLAVLLAVSGAGSGALAQSSQGFPPDKIEQIVAPIALYPDALLSQVLMASTYPLEIVEADRWVRANPNLKGKSLDDALAKQTWDASVISLCKLPDVLSKMSQNLDWTQDLGDAFLAQQADVMKAVQKLRNDAYKAGNLKTTEQQKVVVEKETIIIQPSSPQVVYVPVYDPVVVYGYPPPPAYYYPAVYAPPPAGYALARGIAWGVGFAIGSEMFGGCDWGHHDVYINNTVINNNNMYKNTNISNRNTNVSNRQNWNHNPQHRGNVNYGNSQLNQKYNQGNRGTLSRDQARGYDRAGQGAGGNNRAGQPTAGTREAGRSGQGTSAKPGDRATTGQKQSSFASTGSGRDTQRASDRGAQSRNKPSSGLSRSSGGGGRSGASSKSSGGGRSGGGRKR